MSHKVNLVRVLTTATGNSTPITLGAKYSVLFQTPAEAGAMDGRTYTYLIVDGNNFELGKGAYTASGTTLARTTVLSSGVNGTLGTSRITLSGTAQVRFIESAEDMEGVRGTRPVTGTSDTLNNSDLGYVVTYSNASAIAVSLAQASVSNLFLDGWAVFVKNKGAGAVTITPATSTIDGAATLVLQQNQGALIWSDGTNYQTFKSRGDLGTAAVRADTDFVRTDASQSLATSAQAQARSNISVDKATLPKSANYTVVAADYGALIKLTSSATLALTAAATLGDGWKCDIRNTSTGVWIIDPNSSETINGLTTFNVYPGENFRLVCDGTGFHTVGTGTGLILLDTKIGSASATLDFTRFDSNRFAKYEFVFEGIFPTTATDPLWIRMSTNGGSTYDTGANYGNGVLYGIGTTSGSLQNLAQTKIDLAVFQGADPGYAMSGRVGVTVLSGWTFVDGTTVATDSSSNARRMQQVFGTYAAAANAMRFTYSAGTINGTIRQYGYSR